jgi:hypothetical protein
VGFKNYAVDIGLDAMIYIPGFIKTGSGIQKLLWGIDTDSKMINLLLLFSK